MTDKKLKPVIKYYNAGKIERAYSVDENGNKQGPYEKYYENGQLLKKGTYKDGKYDGPYEEYLDNGQLLKKSTYKDGKEDGPYESYWRNGQLCVKCTYKDGKLDGPYELYWRNGQLYVKCTYKDGKKDGPYEEYHENGQLDIKCTYKDGKEDGPYEMYHENGQLKEKGVYKMGKRLYYGEEAEEYLKGKYPIEYKKLQEQEEKEAREKPIRERKGLNARLAQMDKQMAPTQLQQSIKRAEVAKFRVQFPNKKDGR